MKIAVAGTLLGMLLVSLSCTKPDRAIQKALDQGSGTVQLPAGLTELRQELRISSNSGAIELVGAADSILKPAADFQGRALIVIDGASNVTLRDFTIDGSRADLQRPTEAPAPSTDYASQFQRNGIHIGYSQNVTVRNVRLREVVNFAILANNSKKLKIEGVAVEDSGGRDAKSRNNSSGGILLEESTQDFEIRNCTLRRILGNGIWTHATNFSKRNLRGLVTGNRVETIGRHAIEIGHANGVRVENNTVQFVGYPASAVDTESAPPAAFATAARVDESSFLSNTATELNGRCFSLDGFHDGEVYKNICRNRGDIKEYPQSEYALALGNTYPEMQSQAVVIRDNVFESFRLGALFLIGENHRVTGNTFRNLNLAQCASEAKTGCPTRETEPDFAKAGIYLAFRAARPNPARDISIDNNRIQGFGMKENCLLAAPTVKPSDNKIGKNSCSDSD